mgnify:CR=1 FL=1
MAVHEVLYAVFAIKPVIGEEPQYRVGPVLGPEKLARNEFNRLADAEAVRGHFHLSGGGHLRLRSALTVRVILKRHEEHSATSQQMGD